ncbi:MAG: fatty acyl-AMP ligase [Mycobacteriaceae bacterium]
MSAFTDLLYRTAATSTKGMVTGEPGEPVRRTWSQLHADARRVAGALARAGVGPGDAVAVLAGSPADIAPVIQGTWMRGASITMLHQPTPRTDLAVWAAETMTVLDMVGARAVVLGSPFEPVRPVLAEQGVTVLDVAALADGPDTEPVDVAEDVTALLQLTSGSTGHPKAVRITHANLGANVEGMRLAGALEAETDVAVSWLPLFHDMGMVGFLTVPMSLGIELVSVTPLDFLANPTLWMELISRYHGTLTAAPNFAYAVLGKRLARAEEGSLDLSSLRFAINGAEPIDPVAVDAFTDAGARFGLDRGAVVCAYGMAEVTLAVSFAELGRGLIVEHLDAEALEVEHRAVLVPADAPHARGFATLGPLLHGLEARVVGPEGAVRDVRGVGVIQLRGVPATPGYLTVDGPVATQDAEGWIDTGDEGYLTEAGHVVVCGRVKDVIIMGGRNIYPTDIERAAGAVAGVRAGNVVAVRIDANDRRESFGVALESGKADDPDEVARIRKEVTAAVVDAVGVRPRTVSVLAPGSLPKTPSGKLRRSSSVDLLTEA